MTKYRILSPLLGLLSGCATFEAETAATDLTRYDTVFRGNSDAYKHYDELRLPFDREALNSLLRHPEQDRFRLRKLILRAAAEKDLSFKSLLSQGALRDDPYFRLFLAAYDFQIADDPNALEVLVSRSDETRGNHVLALEYVDEWSKTIQVIGDYETHVDGALGLDLGGFWIARERLFPESYHKYKKRSDIRRLLEKRVDGDIRAKLDARMSRPEQVAADHPPAPWGLKI